MTTSTDLILGGVNLGSLTDYLFFFADGSSDANWQGASKGFIGDVAVNGLLARERTSGDVPFSGRIVTNDLNLGSWQKIIDKNPGTASVELNASTEISDLTSDLVGAFAQINALTVSGGYESVSAMSLDGLNTQNGVSETFVINVTSGFKISETIDITGDSGDVYILRWDSDANFDNGYQGQVKFQSGGGINPLGDLSPGNFIHVAGDINASGGGSTPSGLVDDLEGLGSNGFGETVNGGGFFTGYWFTTGSPDKGDTSSLSNAIFVGGWYTLSDKFSLTSGTSGVYVAPPETPKASLGDFVFNDLNRDGCQDPDEMGIDGVTVRLIDAATGAVIATTTTGDNAATPTVEKGYYFFADLDTSLTYNVEFLQPTGFDGVSPGKNPACDKAEDSDGIVATPGGVMTGDITLEPGEINVDIDQGFFKQPATGKIGDFVFNDKNCDGIQDAGEYGIAGATVKLLSAAGDLIAETTTDHYGKYLFSGLEAGDYRVMFVTPDGFDKASPQNAGYDDTKDSDGDPITLTTDIISLSAGERDYTVDQGFHKSYKPNPASTSTLFGDDDGPAEIITWDHAGYELGVKFMASVDGDIVALRYWRGAEDSGDTDIRTLNLWTALGDKIGTASVTSNPGETGWQTATLSTPVALDQGETYIASYGTEDNYAFTSNFFDGPTVSSDGHLVAPSSGESGGNGVFNEDLDMFPTASFNASNYWVDIVFEPDYVVI